MATIEQAVSGGVSFALTEEQKALRQLAREFAEKEIRSKAAEYDEHSSHPADVIAKAETAIATESKVRTAILAGTDPHEAYRQFGKF